MLVTSTFVLMLLEVIFSIRDLLFTFLSSKMDYLATLKLHAKAHGMPTDQVQRMVKYADHLLKSELPVIFDQRHLSYLLGYEYPFIYSMCQAKNEFYKEYKIPKKRGGTRIIDEPFPSLKECQRWILDNILWPYGKSTLSGTVKAFVPKKGLRENARFHRAQEVVLSLDLSDFFGSVLEKDVYLVFHTMGYNASVSKCLTELCTLNGSLPQGSPSSPMLSNLVFTKFDEIIYSFCRSRGIRYTRYADDLTFSGSFAIGEVVGYVRKVLSKSSFSINDKKTKVARQSMRQCVTGVVVNEKMQAPVFFRKRIRQEIYYIFRFGLESHMKKSGQDCSSSLYLQRLLGRISFVMQINPRDEMAKGWYNFVLSLYNKSIS